MLELSHANEGNQMIPQRKLDISAHVVSETGGSRRQATRREHPPGIPFGYTNSLEDLIQGGRKFETIYAEPPWPCDWAPELGSFYYRKPVSGEALAGLPVRQLAAPSAQVYLWAPDHFLLDAIRVLDAWGFTHTGSLIWMIPEPGAEDDWFTVHRFLLHGVRCESPSPKFRPRSWVRGVQTLVGSVAEPHGVKSIIEQVSPFPRLHLFNEVVSMGWTSWGQRVPRPFDPDEDDDWDDEICEREHDAQGEGLVADSPTFIDVAEKPTRQMHP